MNAISVNSKYKEECLKVLELINSDSKFRDMLAYGVEGNTFEYVSDGVIKKLRDDWPLAAYTQGTFFKYVHYRGCGSSAVGAGKETERGKHLPPYVLVLHSDITNIQNEVANFARQFGININMIC